MISLAFAQRRLARRLASIGLILAVTTATGAQSDDPARPGPPSETGSALQQLQAMVGTVQDAVVGGEFEAETAAATPAADPVPAVTNGALSDTPPVTQSAGGRLDVHVRDLDLATVLEMLSYEARANIVASTSVTGRVSANLYDVTLEQALLAILTPNRYRFEQVGNTIFVGTAEEIRAFGPPPPPPVTRVFELRYVRPDEAAKAVKAVLTSDGVIVEGGQSKAAASGGTSNNMLTAGGDYLVITDRLDRMKAVEEILAQIDVRPRQVLIESTILRATLNESNEFGIDFTMLGGVDFQGVGSSSNASADLTTGQLPAADFQSTTFNVGTAFASNVADGGFTFGLIKDSIATFIRALEEITDVVVVANPKIVALNKQESQVIVGRRDGYITTTVTETAAVQTVQFLETGTQIRFRPIINDDGTVRLVVHPKDSNGGLNAANLPFEETTEAQADVLVRDGHTILIGGLFRERTLRSRAQIPLLGDLPGLGLLFGSQSDDTTREEVIILLTVRVLSETSEEAARFDQLVDDVERVRVGSRRGLLFSGRERLAQAYFHEAIRRIDAGDTGRALLNIRMTLNNQPNHVAAIKLYERLRDRRLWDDEGSRMRDFIWDLVQRESDPALMPRPAFGRPEMHVGTLPPELLGDGDTTP